MPGTDDDDAPTLREVVDLVHSWYPPATADDWDRVGLAIGELTEHVHHILVAVDPAPSVAAEACDLDADLLLVHHPLFLKPVHGFTSETPKGRTAWRLMDVGCALLTAHTNADQAVRGVSEAMARVLGLTNLAPLVPAPAEPYDKLVVFTPQQNADVMRAALAEVGAGRLGDYEHASFTTVGEGRFRPLPGANPTIGTVGDAELVDEVRIEVVMPRGARARVVRAMLAVHPYEEPAFEVMEMADTGLSETGAGRIGDVEPTTLAAFAQHVAEVLPETVGGVRVAGDPDRPVRRVALCGGAGDFLLETVRRTDADVYVTSDLRHHPASEHLEHAQHSGGPALVDVSHWAAESTWLPVVAERLRAALGERVRVTVSTRRTDPWTHLYR
ncbi:Nif3-like dinuclear metal center hexameric protein [Nocardioides acrostichi]|uniref:GTP cyclohydrolase 1 type 2 homolog n=1 Tax=Nocardioides acrostichi TaxID=2784339 RepID=A0A930V2Y7_9ACTN|nr:Nif3-like dinuclear metal center hexameric protein [Nocardioides acrostichi]MBF4162842.1 Nif3-like dinuclear metal center hexameric protein [Nocardioides acrostichi]